MAVHAARTVTPPASPAEAGINSKYPLTYVYLLRSTAQHLSNKSLDLLACLAELIDRIRDKRSEKNMFLHNLLLGSIPSHQAKCNVRYLST